MDSIDIAVLRQAYERLEAENAELRKHIETIRIERNEMHAAGVELEAEVAALRPIAEAVAAGEMLHSVEGDCWVLRFANPTLSYGMTVWHDARAALHKPTPAAQLQEAPHVSP